MNIFIDFDHTLYNTPLLTKDMLDALAIYISKVSKIFNYDYKEATNIVNNVINNGTQYLFEDSIPFLKGLKKKNHKVYILSYNENEVYFQAVKIAGSGLLKYVDGVFPTTTLKGEIPLDFSKCIFIDDKPKDLISIYNNHPFKVFRIRRKNDTYSEIETNLPIPEFTSLEELQKNI